MKNIYKLGLSALAILSIAQAASAIAIQGYVAFDGSVSLDQPIPTATKFVSFTNSKVSVGTQTGAYVGTAGTAVTMEPLQYDPFLAPDTPFWSFSSGGLDYSFDFQSLTSLTAEALGNGLFRLTAAGVGIANITGYDPTPGAFSITTTGNASATNLGFGAFTFVAGTTSQVPDSGTSLSLVAIGLVGIAGASRKLRKTK